MISNKDLRVEDGNIIINGEKHPLDPAVEALTKRANIVQGKLSALDTKLDAIEALEKTASGNPISLTGVAAAYAMGISMTIEPIQSGSGEPSPTNVRPISGISEAVVTRLGKNLLCGRIVGKAISSSGYFVESLESTMCYAPVVEGETYKITSHDFTKQLMCAYYYEKPTVASVSYNQSRIVEYNSNFIVTAPITGYIAFRVYNSVDNETQIEIGSTATDYEAPVTPDTATITLGKTVYGGGVNFKTGEVTVTHKSVTFVGAETENWTLGGYSGNEIFIIDLVDIKQVQGIVDIFSGKADKLKTVSFNELYNSSNVFCVAGSNNTNLYCKFGSNVTLADVKAWLSTNHLQLCYELATPTTLTLTPAELELLKGENTISGNGANINLSYIGR